MMLEKALVLFINNKRISHCKIIIYKEISVFGIDQLF